MFEGIDLNQIMKQAQDFQKELEKKKVCSKKSKNKFKVALEKAGSLKIKEYCCLFKKRKKNIFYSQTR